MQKPDNFGPYHSNINDLNMLLCQVKRLVKRNPGAIGNNVYSKQKTKFLLLQQIDELSA